MRTPPTPEETRLRFGNLNPTERQNLRQTDEWTTCFQAWLASESPSEIRERLADEETLLIWLDSKANRLLWADFDNRKFQQENPQAPKAGDGSRAIDPVELMTQLFPYPENWEDREEEEIPPDLRSQAVSLLKRVVA